MVDPRANSSRKDPLTGGVYPLSQLIGSRNPPYARLMFNCVRR